MSNDIRSQFRVLFPVGPFPLEGEDSLERIFSLSGVLMKKRRGKEIGGWTTKRRKSINQPGGIACGIKSVIMRI